MASNGVSLGTKSTIQFARTAASDPVSEMGHSWLRRGTVVNGFGKSKCKTTNSRVATRSQMQSNGELYCTCQDLLLNSRVYDTYALMEAEARTVGTARTWSGPTTMDPSILAKDAACHVCGKGHFAKDCWHQSGNRGSGKGQKGKKGKKGKKGQRKGTKPKDGDAKKKGASHNCGEVGHFANVRRRKKQAMQVPVVEVVHIARRTKMINHTGS